MCSRKVRKGGGARTQVIREEARVDVKKWIRPIVAVLLLGTTTGAAANAAELRGSRASMLRQNGIAKDKGLTFVETPAQVSVLVDEGELVPVEGNEDYEVAEFVSHRAARPETKLLVERLAAQYREATGEKLVVTSLTRPTSRQPRNASPLSVHPAGMAVDLRIPSNREARAWLESTLLSLEAQGVLDVTREKNPPHYHVAVFPDAYMAHVERIEARKAERLAQLAERQAAEERRASARMGVAEKAEDRAAEQIALIATLAAMAVLAVPTLRERVIRAGARIRAKI